MTYLIETLTINYYFKVLDKSMQYIYIYSKQLSRLCVLINLVMHCNALYLISCFSHHLFSRSIPNSWYCDNPMKISSSYRDIEHFETSFKFIFKILEKKCYHFTKKKHLPSCVWYLSISTNSLYNIQDVNKYTLSLSVVSHYKCYN